MGNPEDIERDRREDEKEKRILRQWRKRLFLPSEGKKDFPDPGSGTRH